jgi:hypothetical protein
MRRKKRFVWGFVLAIALSTGAIPAAAQYKQVNLASDLKGQARFTEPIFSTHGAWFSYHMDDAQWPILTAAPPHSTGLPESRYRS